MLCCLALPALPCLVLSCRCLVLSLSCLVLSCRCLVLSCRCLVLFCLVLSCVALWSCGLSVTSVTRACFLRRNSCFCRSLRMVPSSSRASFKMRRTVCSSLASQEGQITRQHKARQDKRTGSQATYKARQLQGKPRYGKARQDNYKARQGMPRQGKARHGKRGVI